MSTKKVLLVILVASTALLAAGVGPRIADTAQALPPAQEAAAPGVTIPYPGRLSDDAGQPVVDGIYDFTFTLYDAAIGGEPLWSEDQEGVPVWEGAFTTSLGSENPIPATLLGRDQTPAIDDRMLWMSVKVRGPGETEFTALTPRQKLSAAAPAAPASPAAGAACPHDHFGERWSGTTSSDGLWVWSADTVGLLGVSTPYSFIHPAGNKYGVWGYSYSDHGVFGQTSGDWGYVSGVYGLASMDHANGVTGQNTAAGPGVYGWSTDGFGVYAVGKDEENFPLHRKGDLMLAGSYGDLFASGFLRLISDSSVIVRLDVNNDGGDGFYLYNGAGQSVLLVDELGNLWIDGTLTESSASFQIDHPLDPDNKYLYHPTVASPDMKNVYDGVVVLGADGTAWVELPAWFETLNRDFRYQLTPIGAPGPNLYIAHEVKANRFQIAGGTPDMKVSWQVTGIRQDAYAEAHRIPVEEEKPPEEQGTYLHPVEHGQPQALGLDYQRDRDRERAGGGP